MGKRIKAFLKKIRISRTTILGLLFIALSVILIYRVYVLQIEHGEEYRSNFSLMTTRTRTLKAARGSIYDRNGNVLASNRLSYSLTIEDSGTYASYREKALALNGEAYRIAAILKKHGDSLSNDFHIVVDENDEYAFDVTGRSLSRFKADVFGKAMIDDLTEQEAAATAAEMVDYLSANDTAGGFSLYRKTRPYTPEELAAYGLPETLTKQETLDILFVRYLLFTTSYRKYVPVTIATEISEASVAEIYEHQSRLTGIEVVEDTVRVYDQPEAFASIIGYIGKVSSEDLSELRDQNPAYNNSSIVGKSGIEKLFELNLQGTDGEETVYVDNLGRVLQKDEAKTVLPAAGENVYLTIDKNLQVAAYKMLEQRIAGVLESMIINEQEFDRSKVTDTSDIRIPITDVYNSLISNHVLDTQHFAAPDATQQESELLAIYNQKEQEVLSDLRAQLTGGKEVPYKELSKEMQEYQSYIVNSFLNVQTKILPSASVNREDPVYLAWAKDEKISLREYLLYAASQSWIDITAFSPEGAYLDSGEIFRQLVDYMLDRLPDSLEFRNTLYRYLILEGRISGKQLVQVLYDQDIFHKDDEVYEGFTAGEIHAYDLVIRQIHDLVLTPAMLALDPCSGSAVITDPKKGEVLACVTYPGYDNNRLANKMDTAYYNLLANDASRPFYNKATQQTTAPGSTFKLVTAAAGLEEGAIDLKTKFDCNGLFELVDTPLACWYKAGHGKLDVVGGIANSCNVFFSNVAFQLGQNTRKKYSDSRSLQALRNYASMFDLDKNSGIEVPEATPQVSDRYAVPSAIGQGTHAYTTTQMARYVTILANGGTSYRLSMVDRRTDADGKVLEDYSPSVSGHITLQTETWEAIRKGMRAVLETNGAFTDVEIPVSGKTGTAQESKSRPSHALFICFAPSDDPTIAMAVRIGNGYTSTNALLAGKDILQYHFNLVDESQLITGKARTDLVTTQQVD